MNSIERFEENAKRVKQYLAKLIARGYISSAEGQRQWVKTVDGHQSKKFTAKAIREPLCVALLDSKKGTVVAYHWSQMKYTPTKRKKNQDDSRVCF